MKSALIHVQVWGKFHVELFVNTVLPNLVYLASTEIDIPYKFIIDTNKESFKDLLNATLDYPFVTVDPCIELSEGETDYPYKAHRDSLDAICKRALEEDAVIFWCWSDQFDAIGTYKTALQKIREGKRYIFMPPTRVHEGFIQEVPIPCYPNQCVHIALCNLHEMHKGCYKEKYEVGSECACHPYAIIERQVGYAQFWIRALQGYVIALYPRQWTPTKGGTDNEVPITEWIGDFDEDVWIFEDSDQGFRVDISPKERNHHFQFKHKNFKDNMKQVLSHNFCERHRRLFEKTFYVHV